jgi:hypothetical protein
MKNNNVKGLRGAYVPMAFGVSLILYSLDGDFNHLRRAFETLIRNLVR